MEFQTLIETSIFYIKLALPFFIVFGLGYALFNMWVIYARRKFLSEQTYVLLRIIPPKEILKTPAAMELFISSLHQTGGEANPIDVYWHGKSRARFSLEIVSIGGEVGFYIRTRTSLKNYIENQIYAQYPGIEVQVVDDYTEQIDYDSGKYSMFGIEYGLSQPDPIPIKTYVDYGLDKPGEEEEKVDPITATTEFLGSIKKGENLWIQIIIKAHKKEDKDVNKWFGKTDYWVDEAIEQIAKIREESFYKNPKDPNANPMPLQTTAQREKIDAIERNISKMGFDVGIRGIYIAEKAAFVGENIPGLIGVFKQYGSTSLNGIKPVAFTSVNYFWQDIFGTRVENLKRQILNDYKNRTFFDSFFGLKYRNKFVLNTEELATIFHFPGGVASTPTLSRIQSRKGEPPSNLPIQ